MVSPGQGAANQLPVHWGQEQKGNNGEKTLTGTLDVGGTHYKVTVNYKVEGDDLAVQRAVKQIVQSMSGGDIQALVGHSVRVKDDETEVQKLGENTWKKLDDLEDDSPVKRVATKVSRIFSKQNFEAVMAQVERQPPEQPRGAPPKDEEIDSERIQERNGKVRWNGQEQMDLESFKQDLEMNLQGLEERNQDHIRENIIFKSADEEGQFDPFVSFENGNMIPLADILDMLDKDKTMPNSPIDAFLSVLQQSMDGVGDNVRILHTQCLTPHTNQLDQELDSENPPERLIVPYNEGDNHWIFYSVDLQEKTIQCFDSVRADEEELPLNEAALDAGSKVDVGQQIIAALGVFDIDPEDFDNLTIRGFGDQHQDDVTNCGRFMSYGIQQEVTEENGFVPDGDGVRDNAIAFRRDMMDALITGRV